MAVELILMDDVPDLGTMGETVRVAEGYARNFLVPRGLATKSGQGALRRLEVLKRRRKEEYERNLAAAQAMAEQVSRHSVSIPVQATEEDKLYGSVTSQQIADALAEMDLPVEKRQIVLQEPIRELGVYDVDVHLHSEVTAQLKVWVVKA